ncbi:MAG: NAD(P)-dependent alcohol dehydrogenase [Nitrososphaeria archaeon]
MKAAVLYKPRDIRIEERPIPKPGKEDVLLKIKNVGICRSDVHFYAQGRIGFFIIKEPIVLGHECCGEIVEKGDSVEGFEVGDRVVIEPGVPCGKCHYCRIGRYELCVNEKFMGAPPTDGAYQEYISWPADFVYKMPDEMTNEEGALIEPFAVGLTAIKMAGGIPPGESVSIIGGGTIGLSTLIAAKESGAGDVFVISRSMHKLELAEKLGANAAISTTNEKLMEIVKEGTKGLGSYIVFDTVGTEETINLAFKLVRDGGRIHELGLSFGEYAKIPMIDVALRELVITGHNKYANIFQSAMRLSSTRKLPLLKLLTHVLTLDEISKGMEMVEKGTDRVIKVQIKMS